VRVPPIEPLFDSRGEIEIYLDLCEKAGILYGEGGYLDHLNKALNLKDPYTLDLTKKTHGTRDLRPLGAQRGLRPGHRIL
jgi:hypothetical protein